jgi:hypothetical protein
MKCEEVIGKGHVCLKCQEEFSHELEAKSRKKAYFITVFGIVMGAYMFSRLPPGTVSKFYGNAVLGYHKLVPTTLDILEKAKEPTSILDIQARLLFGAVVFALIASFALLTFARKRL